MSTGKILLALSAEEANAITELVNAGIEDMGSRKQEGWLEKDGYTQDDIAALDQTLTTGQDASEKISNALAKQDQTEEPADEAERCTRIAMTVLRGYHDMTSPEELGDQHSDEHVEAMIDLLADLIHYCDTHDVDFQDVTLSALNHAEQERGMALGDV